MENSLTLEKNTYPELLEKAENPLENDDIIKINKTITIFKQNNQINKNAKDLL